MQWIENSSAGQIPFLIDAIITNSRRGDSHPPRSGRDLARPRFAIARDERVSIRVLLIAIPLEVLLDFHLERSVQHALRTCETDRIQRAGQPTFVPFRADLDCIRHRWRVHSSWRRWPCLIVSYTEGYAVFFKALIYTAGHNS